MLSSYESLMVESFRSTQHNTTLIKYLKTDYLRVNSGDYHAKTTDRLYPRDHVGVL